MAQRGFTTTTELQGQAKENVIRIRSTAQKMETDVVSYVEKETARYREQMKNKTPEEVEELVEEVFAGVKAKVNGKLDEMKEEVKSHAPKKPQRNPKDSEESFQWKQQYYKTQMDNYRTFVSYVGGFLEGLVSLFDRILESIKQFFRDLWKWIKQALKNIAEKVANFMKYLKKEISTGFSALFGW
ncbi:hypothetical protein BaRGS_00009700 [Batillaria attramentaria]|uniref:Uncharacterized protein n=1 Tax=Batillaria attramentaria TaxID=370345 RepID=A0ABD0LJ29_9CAEN